MSVGYTKSYLEGVSLGIPSANIALVTSVVEHRLTVDSVTQVMLLGLSLSLNQLSVL